MSVGGREGAGWREQGKAGRCSKRETVAFDGNGEDEKEQPGGVTGLRGGRESWAQESAGQCKVEEAAAYAKYAARTRVGVSNEPRYTYRKAGVYFTDGTIAVLLRCRVTR